MRKIIVHMESGIVGGDREEEIEVDDDATEEEIEECARDAFFNYYGYSWSEKE